MHAAIDVVGDAAPAGFHRSLPGRCALRLGPDELLVFQTAHVTRPADAVVAVCAAAEPRVRALFNEAMAIGQAAPTGATP